MFEQYLTAFHGGLVFASVILALVVVLLIIPVTRRDLIAKALIVRDLFVAGANEIANEFGPVLKTSTGRNAALLSLTGVLGTLMPEELAESGAGLLIIGCLVWYTLRTWEGRKRAAGPIETPLDRNAYANAGNASGPGAEHDRLGLPLFTPGHLLTKEETERLLAATDRAVDDSLFHQDEQSRTAAPADTRRRQVAQQPRRERKKVVKRAVKKTAKKTAKKARK